MAMIAIALSQCVGFVFHSASDLNRVRRISVLWTSLRKWGKYLLLVHCIDVCF